MWAHLCLEMTPFRCWLYNWWDSLLGMQAQGWAILLWARRREHGNQSNFGSMVSPYCTQANVPGKQEQKEISKQKARQKSGHSSRERPPQSQEPEPGSYQELRRTLSLGYFSTSGDNGQHVLKLGSGKFPVFLRVDFSLFKQFSRSQIAISCWIGNYPKM